MTVAAVGYANARIPVKQTDLTSWTVDWTNETASGPCPRCGDETRSPLYLDAVAMAPRGSDPPPGITRLFECRCETEHADGTATKPTCGAYWLARVEPKGAKPPIVPAPDDKMFDAAKTLLQTRPNDEARIRAAADKWIAGVSAILGLFTLSALVSGKDSLAGLPKEARVVIALTFLVALVSAALALLNAYQAAYGWPTVVDLDDDSKLLDWHEKYKSSAESAAKSLRRGVYFALGALAALVLAVGMLWFWPAKSPATKVQLTLTNDAMVCGELLATKTTGTVRIRTGAGEVHEIVGSQVGKASVVDKCPA